MNRELIGRAVLDHFERKWSQGDPWDLSTSPFEAAKYASQAELLAGLRFHRVLEIGCGNGVFTRMLAQRAQSVVAIDIAPSAIEAARVWGDSAGRIDYRIANAMEFDVGGDGPWDLIVLSETLPYIGWLYPLFDVAWLAKQLHENTASGGKLLMANTCGGVSDYLLSPWLIETYLDLFRNVGYSLEREELFSGKKDGARIHSKICLFTRGQSSTS